MKRAFAHLLPLFKLYCPHTALLELDISIIESQHKNAPVKMKEDVLKLKEGVSVTFDTTSFKVNIIAKGLDTVRLTLPVKTSHCFPYTILYYAK